MVVNGGMMTGEFVFEDSIEPAMAARLATSIWAGLAFDDAARAALKRDGLVLDGLRLGGPMPFVFARVEASRIRVTTPEQADADALLDLFRVWLLPRLRAAASSDETA